VALPRGSIARADVEPIVQLDPLGDRTIDPNAVGEVRRIGIPAS
jgi:hypothetical protein